MARIFARRAELERRRMPARAPGSAEDREFEGETPFGPAETFRCLGEGLLEVLVEGDRIYRLAGPLVDALPAWLRLDRDGKGFAWYSRRQRPLLTLALPRFFLPLEHKVSSYELARDFPRARAMFRGDVPEDAARAEVRRYAPPQRDPGPIFPWILSTPRRPGALDAQPELHASSWD